MFSLFKFFIHFSRGSADPIGPMCGRPWFFFPHTRTLSAFEVSYKYALHKSTVIVLPGRLRPISTPLSAITNQYRPTKLDPPNGPPFLCTCVLSTRMTECIGESAIVVLSAGGQWLIRLYNNKQQLTLTLTITTTLNSNFSTTDV